MNGAEAERKRLYVALDFQSLGAMAFEIEYIDHAVAKIVEERFGTDWKREIYRIYPGGEKRELMGRMRWLRRERKIRKWRFPKHKGRRAPVDWDYWVSRHAVSWCVRDRDARPENTVCVLVSNGGDYQGMVTLLMKNKVEVLVVGWGDEFTDIKDTVGEERLFVRQSAERRW